MVLSDLAAITAADPTVVTAIEQLRGCQAAFSHYLSAHGVEGFVRAAYIYVLGRPADAAGLAAYAGQLRDTGLAPYDVLRELYESEEFHAAPRLLVAPPEAGFVFHQP